MMIITQPSLFPARRIAWFSCGAASAVTAMLALKSGPAEVVYCDTSQSEHEDNARFIKDVEKWLGVTVTIISSTRFANIDEVFERERYMSGVAGAKCTVEMKKKPRFRFQRADDIHMFGFTVDEQHRIKQFERSNPELRLEWPLRDAGMTKADTLRIIAEAGIELPVMYHLGFENNNCLGCVKAQSPAYWNRTRLHFPAVFARRAAQSRNLGVKLVKVGGVRIFLDELPPDCDEALDEDLSCGPQCGVNASSDPR